MRNRTSLGARSDIVVIYKVFIKFLLGIFSLAFIKSSFTRVFASQSNSSIYFASYQVRFEMCAQALHPKIGAIAPWRDPRIHRKLQGT